MKKIFIIIAFISALIGCKKSEDNFRPLSSYTVVNATTDIVNARVYAADHEISWKVLPATDAVGQYLKPGSFGAYAGNNIIKAVNGADTTKILYSSSKAEELQQAKLSTLFLAGNATAGYEGILLSNETPGNYTDSVIGIRIINLSPNSTPLNITLSTAPTVNEATGVAYKQITNFKTYPSLYNTAAMIFQIRDAANVLLATYTLPLTPASPHTTVGMAHSRFKNITLVIKGLQGTTSGTNALGIIPVAGY